MDQRLTSICGNGTMDAYMEKLQAGTMAAEAFRFVAIHQCNLNENAIRQLDNFLPPTAAGTPMADAPLISVIIPTFNRKGMLTEAVESVLWQVYPRLEVLILDDVSTDGTSDWVQMRYGSDPRIRYVRNEASLHAGRTRQKGYQLAQGDFVVFLDDDDFYLDRHFFAKAVTRLQAEPRLALVCANGIQWFTETDEVRVGALNIHGTMSGSAYLQGFQLGLLKPFSTFTSVFRKASLDTADLADMGMMNDGPIYMRALLTGDVHAMDDIIGVYRLHTRNISYQLPLDFLMANLLEKKKVYDIAQERGLLADPAQWLYDHWELTTKYYVQGTIPAYGDVRTLQRWIHQHGLDWKDRLNRNITYWWARKQVAIRLGRKVRY